MNNDDDKTRLIGRGAPRESDPAVKPVEDDGDATRIIGSRPARPADPDETRILPGNPSQPVEPGVVAPVSNGEQTVLHRRPKKQDPVVAVPQNEAVERELDSLADPVTGWLVVIQGPGKGNSIEIGEQDNAVGRGENARAKLDFGDNGVSRGCAFIVRYDPKKKRFKLLPGEGKNIVYLNDEDLDSPVVINSGDVIEVCSTKLRFVPFCSESFDWSDTE